MGLISFIPPVNTTLNTIILCACFNFAKKYYIKKKKKPYRNYNRFIDVLRNKNNMYYAWWFNVAVNKVFKQIEIMTDSNNTVIIYKMHRR